ncbi:MAG: clostripain-related cysteine peptidase [Candidatus Thorarchaeota archaeon]
MFGKNYTRFLIFFIIIISQFSLSYENYNILQEQESLQSKTQLELIPNNNLKNVDVQITELIANSSWTYMLYLDADNDIEADAIRDFEWLEEAGGSDENISFVVLLDRIPGYDDSHGGWTGSRIYNVTDDVSPLSIDSQLLVDLGEVDMANTATLTNFITYCFDNFPAEHYILDLWNHGHAAYGVIDDETSGTHFIVDEVQTAISNALATSTEEIDIISMDACDMSTIEVAWEFRDLCKYFISSEDGTNGYPYRVIADGLQANPETNASALCKLMIDAYATHYSYYFANCLSAINETKLKDIPEVFNAFISELISTLGVSSYRSLFAMSRELTHEFYDGNWIDLISLIENIIFFIDEHELVQKGEELLAILDEVVAYNWQSQTYSGSANGLTIYMPFELNMDEFVDDYCNQISFTSGMDWITDTTWDNFLQYCNNNHLYSYNIEPELISAEEVKEDLTISQNVIQMFRVNLWKKGIYEFLCPISSGDVDFKVIEFDYSGMHELIGGSYFVNPDDDREEKSRFRLESGFYYIFVYGKATSSNYQLVVKECEPIELVCNSPHTLTSGSSNGDGLGHYNQDLNHYFQINLPYGNNTIILSSSDTISCQLTIISEDWKILDFFPAEDLGNFITYSYNQTSENQPIIYLEIRCIDGYGEFTIEITNPNEPTPKAEIHFLLLLFTLPVIAIFNKKNHN